MYYLDGSPRNQCWVIRPDHIEQLRMFRSNLGVPVLEMPQRDPTLLELLRGNPIREIWLFHTPLLCHGCPRSLGGVDWSGAGVGVRHVSHQVYQISVGSLCTISRAAIQESDLTIWTYDRARRRNTGSDRGSRGPMALWVGLSTSSRSPQ